MPTKCIPMYEYEPCNTCKHRRDDGRIESLCLTCKWPYSEFSEAFEHKPDLYVKEEHHAE